MSYANTTRRRFLKLVAGAGAAPYAFATPAPSGSTAPAGGAIVGDGVVTLEYDSRLRSRIAHVREGGKLLLTDWNATETLELAGGRVIETFTLETVNREPIDDPLGRGVRLRVRGTGSSPGLDSPRVEKTVQVELLERYPGFALLTVSYRNASSEPVALKKWRCVDMEVLSQPDVAEEPPFWTYCGSTHVDRRDWVQPLRQGFHQENFLGMVASDYGGGIPVADVWRRDCGVAVGHLETRPHPLALPVHRTARGAAIAITGHVQHKLAPGETFTAPAIFVAVHGGDYFGTLDSYRRRMAEQGVCPAQPPATAFESIWCAWGYERSCTVPLIEGTLPKVKELGLRWAVVDDGWQNNVGDWKLNTAKYPHGDADMQALTAKIRSYDLKPRLWIAPLAATPGSDVLHDHPDMLLLNQDGAPQLISWWNAFYLCPAYAKTVAFHEDIVRRILANWGYAGLKLDGQHLNGVAPCYNPAHRHTRPEESLEGLQDFFQSLYAVAMKIDPQTVMELCPCGTGFSFFNLEYANQAPASDPESSWQVRHKGKTLKALMGPHAPFAGDHVELSDGHDDFASTVGIGAVVSTKFTWPRDPKPKDSFLLTPDREVLWRKWISLYNERMLPQGTYRGELYDLGFDKPEGHVVEKSGRLYYAFFAERWSGPVMLRGLRSARYRVRDYFNERDHGELAGPTAALSLSFERFQVLEAIPV